MANQKIIALNELTAIADNDMFAISDVSATETKKITRKNILPEVTSSNIISNRLQTATKDGLNKCIDKAVGDTAITASGWIEDEKFGLYMLRTATAVSAEFDTAITRTGRATVKLSTTDATGQASIYTADDLSATFSGSKRMLIPVKASTKYVFNIFAKGKLLTANSVYATINTYDTSFTTLTTATSNKLGAGNSDWTLLQATITTGAGDAYLVIGLHNMVAGTIQDAYFDWNGATLQEVITDTTNANAYPTQIKPIFVANSEYTGIDQSLDPTGAYANTYAVPTAIDEGATNRQTFTPTKKKMYKIGINIVDKGTGDWTLLVHDSSNNIVAGSSTATPNASITNGWTYFVTPDIWTSGALHFHVISTVNDGTVKTNTSNDLEDASFIELYGKNSEGFDLVANGVRTRLLADRDGLLEGSIWNLEKGTFEFYASYNNQESRVVDLYKKTGTTRLLFGSSGLTASTSTYADIKVNTILPIKKLTIRPQTTGQTATEVFACQLSSDGINWVTFDTVVDVSGGVIIETDAFNSNIIFIRQLATSGTIYVASLYIKAELDMSSLKLPTFYPINLLIQETKSVKSRRAPTRIYFRANKFANEQGVIQPCFELMDSGGSVNYETVFLDFDNSQETNPSVNILSSSTNWQASGTGSAIGATGYNLNDGEYMTLTSAEDDLKLDYQVGYGTTTFNNPTKNTYYLASPANSSDSTQDPSLMSEIIFNIPQKNIMQELADTRKELNSVKQYPATKSGLTLGSGTDYTLTTSLAVVAFGTSGNLEVRIPEAGTYEITADIHEDASGVTASASANYSLYQLYKDGNAVANSQRKGFGFPILASALAGLNSVSNHFSWIIRVETPNSLVSLYAKQNSATTGNWVLTSGATGVSRIGYKRLN